MGKRPFPDDDELQLAALQRIDRICVAFEDAWKADQRPRPEEYLGQVSESERASLLRELLLVESHYRRARGESLDAEEYRARFPDYAQIVAQVLRPVVVCPHCAAEVPESNRRCPNCGREMLADDETRARLSPEGTGVMSGDEEADRTLSAGVAEHGRFLPGCVLVNRYRIVGLLGRGGMGEVYRADDLKLGQPLALKFLPERLADRRDVLKLFHNEVRLARQVSHPNICRVHDIGEVDGQHFLSMEYVDGEDLANLLRRIGRLPPDKGLAIARQLVAGLAAAHDRGILHRDLKPANVMLDGRGQVRITDFGLACLSDASGDPGLLAGTPGYMAPEQLAGEPPTVRSDLYSVGLILYEIFTGQRPFEERTPAELERARRKKTPIAPSRFAEGLDPAVERTVLLCLEADPQNRPASASALLAALPGSDPLEAALAAGETPSPQMVAAAGQDTGLHPSLGVLCLVGVLLGLLAVTALSDRTTLVGYVELEKPPDVLAERARAVIARLGYEEAARDRAYGFAYVTSQPRMGPICFWYRQSPSPLVPQLFAGSLAAKGDGTVSLADPPPGAGDVGIQLDPQGRLIALRASPAASRGHASAAVVSEGAGADTGFPDWCVPLFRSAELIGEQDETIPATGFRPAPTDWTACVSSDSRRTWRGLDPKTDWPVRIEAAAWRGAPVHFRLVPQRSEASGGRQPVAWRSTGGLVATVAFVCALALAVGLARRNLRAGRGDRQGALRLACFLFVVSMLAWLLRTSRGAMPPGWTVFMMGVQYHLFWSLTLWLFFIALEPYVRRVWPQTLISWNRLLAGRFRDPRVGRDVLVGALVGVGTRVLWQVNVLAPGWFGLEPSQPFGSGRRAFEMLLGPLLGGRHCISDVLQCLAAAIRYGLFVVLLLLLLRLILRKQWLAVAAYILFAVVVWMASIGHPYISGLVAALVSLMFVFLLLRFGLVAVVSYTFVRLLLTFPITADLSTWHVGSSTLLPLGIIAALACWGFYLSLAGRPLIRAPIG